MVYVEESFWYCSTEIRQCVLPVSTSAGTVKVSKSKCTSFTAGPVLILLTETIYCLSLATCFGLDNWSNLVTLSLYDCVLSFGPTFWAKYFNLFTRFSPVSEISLRMWKSWSWKFVSATIYIISSFGV